jgi:hypothetical protein
VILNGTSPAPNLRNLVPFFTAALLLLNPAFKVFAQTSVPSVSTSVQTEREPKPFSFPIKVNLISYNEINEASANTGQGEVQSTNSIRLLYEVDSATTARLDIDTTNNWINRDSGNGQFSFLDPHVQLARSGIVTNDAGLALNGFARYIAPFSASSQRANIGGGIRLGLELAQTLFEDRLTVAYNFIPQINILNQTSFLNENDELQGARRGFLWHYVEVAYEFVPGLSAYTDLGLKHVDYMEDSRVLDYTSGDHNYLYANLALTYAPVELFELELGITEDESRDLTADDSYFALYRDDETSYYLQGRLAF